MIEFTVNGFPQSTDAPADTPLLWVLREGLKLTGTKFGCGAGLCGACMVHIDGARAFSCQTQVGDVAGHHVGRLGVDAHDALRRSRAWRRAWSSRTTVRCVTAAGR